MKKTNNVIFDSMYDVEQENPSLANIFRNGLISRFRIYMVMPYEKGRQDCRAKNCVYVFAKAKSDALKLWADNFGVDLLRDIDLIRCTGDRHITDSEKKLHDAVHSAAMHRRNAERQAGWNNYTKGLTDYRGCFGYSTKAKVVDDLAKEIIRASNTGVLACDEFEYFTQIATRIRKVMSDSREEFSKAELHLLDLSQQIDKA
jgi:hypothetical protein